MSNAINWFEIPAANFQRAVKFYETLLDLKLKTEQMGGSPLAVFPYSEPGVGGCVMAGDGCTPGQSGSVIYLNAGPRLDDALARIGKAGGSVAVPKTMLPDDMGCFAQVIDSEGNRVGLHALA